MSLTVLLPTCLALMHKATAGVLPDGIATEKTDALRVHMQLLGPFALTARGCVTSAVPMCATSRGENYGIGVAIRTAHRTRATYATIAAVAE